ncbi:MAG TPA: Ig-like domain repeat protein, partial [Chloroflexota bacterium]|nr:Ig-like domain repeat protein [Chloroflexota bacterium]
MDQRRVVMGTDRERPDAGRGRIRRLLLTAALMLGTIPALLAGPVGRAHAATDSVTDCSGPIGAGRLVTVVGAAAAGDTVNFACSGTITLTSTLSLTQDVMIDGTGQAVTISGGGAVQVLSIASGTAVNLNKLTITNGSGNPSGGGITNAGTLTVTNSTFSGNTAGVSNGGGIDNEGTLTVASSTFTGNSAFRGGAIYSSSGPLTVTNSTFTGNSVGVGGTGGALDMNAGSATLTNVTMAGNTAAGGGGIYNNAVVAVTNSIVAQNTGGDCGGIAVSNGGGDLDSDAGCGFGTGHTAASAGLGALAGFGGPTQTMPLLLGSPALGLGDPAACAAAPVNGLDQRGVTRSLTVCDSGAYQTTPLTMAPPGVPNTIAPYVFLPDGIYGNPNLQSVQASGGSGSYNYSITSGTLPTGLALIGPVGLIVGILGSGGGPYPRTFTFTVTALDTANPQIGRQSYSLTVDPASTTAVLGANPATGQTITLTASVLGGVAFMPTGTVSFHDGSAVGPVISCTGGNQTLNASGIATCQTSTLSLGPHTVFAVYGGDGDFTGSTSNGAPVTVSPLPPALPPAQTPIIAWAAPAPITYGTALDGTELNAVATINGSPVGGTMTYSPPAGTVLHVGANQQLAA